MSRMWFRRTGAAAPTHIVLLMLVVLAMLALVAVQKAGATLAPGRLYGWGDNDSGQATVPAGEDFIRVSAGAQHSLALKIDHTVVG